MSCTEALSQWEETVSRHLPHLSKPQAVVLALWSYAMIMSQSCGTSSAALWRGELLGGSYDAWRQRLREWCYDAHEKKGRQRSARGGGELFCALTPLDHDLVGNRRTSLSSGSGCQYALGSLYGALHQCALSRLCASSGLVSRGERRTGGLETGLDRAVGEFGWRDPRRLDGDRPRLFADSMLVGSTRKSSRWVGIPFCASTKAAKRVRKAAIPITGWQPMSRCRTTLGVGRCAVLRRHRRDWIVRWWLAGMPITRTPGSS